MLINIKGFLKRNGAGIERLRNTSNRQQLKDYFNANTVIATI